MEKIFKRMKLQDITSNTGSCIDSETLEKSQSIIDQVKIGGDEALRSYGLKFGDILASDPLIIGPSELNSALLDVPQKQLELLKRVAGRIESFARAQLKSLTPFSSEFSGVVCQQIINPVKRAGCYAPGGNYPLPSSILMTAITARVAGVEDIIVATPRPSSLMLAAAKISGASKVLAVGGAQAIAAMAHGTETVDKCDIIVGPGNKWVTAAKQLIGANTKIDMLAGPTELLVIADSSANPKLVAADLLAQAEHDIDAKPMLVAFDESFIVEVEKQILKLLESLPTKSIAEVSIASGSAFIVASIEEAIEVSDALAPEHVQISTKDPAYIADRLRNYGAVFIGEASAEVFGDYGFGPNHVLPTSGQARFTGGLSVFDFLKVQTSLEVRAPNLTKSLTDDAIELAELEGLAGHALAARLRLPN